MGTEMLLCSMVESKLKLYLNIILKKKNVLTIGGFLSSVYAIGRYRIVSAGAFFFVLA